MRDTGAAAVASWPNATEYLGQRLRLSATWVNRRELWRPNCEMRHPG